MEMLNQRIRDCRRINMMLRVKNGEGWFENFDENQLPHLDEALDEAAKLQGFHIFAQILRSYKHQPAAYSLQFCARVLPTLRPMLSHKNVEYVDLALDTLANLLNEFSEPIKHVLAANAMGTIGVDVAAEARYAFCTTSKQAFTNLYLNSSFIISRLRYVPLDSFKHKSFSPDQRDYFNMLLPIIERIVEL
jgi:hypothetical protein